ncbi:hypothetical protein Aci011_108 [Acinetobacter phage vB_AbaM_B09_Aci01-1]|uniref:Uncharacterized protein n=3 Tax=Saclayvirus TaxID=2733128 RepID=A0A386KJA9_9CAUD|nr:hypothetical protein HOU29_gp073 [Acinetobacter phage vB_AbaM_B09_Aci01-1]YP_009813331.1 hypothetical protein HOU30_gp081 [Acinetobacter phage vB_AbaM_B09_Aci02-2]YP_009813961.1 hypothetical protein HOU35_gp070 [Acinetobacter phage vB_AbaM_B09_Aci05]AYD82350.1 hypothetical protein Aci05_107 [Acinetobacter phage vB_AbaM_B09_Aci05]AYD85562.1 hypothetical protein Aci011_108 [Acinetobacter phage vB_AbaM_B09_Aci01-1]AYD85725.1 hypothetical protein Aci022_109 [Acinetobacter phage vB_AbaM_B09_Aci0
MTIQFKTQVFREAPQITELRRWFISTISKKYGVNMAIQSGVLFDECLTMSYIGYRNKVPAVSGINIPVLAKKFTRVNGGFDVNVFNDLCTRWILDEETAFDTGLLGKSQYDGVHIHASALQALKIIYNQLRIGFAAQHLSSWVYDHDNWDVVLNLALCYTREFTNKEFSGHVQRIANISRDSAIVMLMSIDGLNYKQSSTLVDLVRKISGSVR